MKTMSVTPSRVSGVGPKWNGAGRMNSGLAGLQPHRPERAHVQPQRRRARTAIVEEGDRPLPSRRAVERVRRVEDARARLARDVADRERPCGRRVLQDPAANAMLWCVETVRSSTGASA